MSKIEYNHTILINNFSSNNQDKMRVESIISAALIHWRIQLFGERATPSPLPIFFSYFFSAEIRKQKLLLSQIGFENCFFEHDRRSPTDFLDPPLL